LFFRLLAVLLNEKLSQIEQNEKNIRCCNRSLNGMCVLAYIGKYRLGKVKKKHPLWKMDNGWLLEGRIPAPINRKVFHALQEK
jgi:hypothetical protein